MVVDVVRCIDWRIVAQVRLFLISSNHVIFLTPKPCIGRLVQVLLFLDSLFNALEGRALWLAAYTTLSYCYVDRAPGAVSYIKFSFILLLAFAQLRSPIRRFVIKVFRTQYWHRGARCDGEVVTDLTRLGMRCIPVGQASR